MARDTRRRPILDSEQRLPSLRRSAYPATEFIEAWPVSFANCLTQERLRVDQRLLLAAEAGPRDNDNGPAACDTCGGDGKCPACHGSGIDQELGEGNCALCLGSGVCPNCLGSGDKRED